MSDHVIVETLRRAAPARPWEAWLLLALMRQVPRQQWLVRVITAGAGDSHEREGELRGWPGWSFLFHGTGCLLSGPGGEHLDVDFHGDGGLTIDSYFFAYRVLALETPARIEERLAQLLPTADLIDHVIRGLVQGGVWLLPGPHRNAFRLAEPLLALTTEAAVLDLDDKAEWLHWVDALEDFAAGVDPALIPERRNRWVDWLRSILETDRASVALDRFENYRCDLDRALDRGQRFQRVDQLDPGLFHLSDDPPPQAHALPRSLDQVAEPLAVEQELVLPGLDLVRTPVGLAGLDVQQRHRGVVLDHDVGPPLEHGQPVRDLDLEGLLDAILLVVSSAPLLASWSGALRQAGYDVTTAREPGVAMVLLSAGAPDIVVVDLGATGRHGLAVLSTVRSLYPSVPVLATGAVGEKLRRCPGRRSAAPSSASPQ